MRKIFLILSVAFTLCLTLCAQTRLVVNTGATANDGTGDSARTSFNKVNTNFATLWAVVYTNGIGATNAFRFSTNAFVTSGTNISLNHTITITNKLTIDGDLLHDMELQDIAQLTLDATDAGLYGVASLFLDGGITTLRGVTNLQVITPAVMAGTATGGQVLTLTDDANGQVEFATVSSFSPGADLATSISSISPGNNVAIPTGATLLDFSATGTITGFSITGQSDGKIISIYVRSGALTLENESASSTAENRIVTGQGNIVARAGSLVTLCLVRNAAGVRRWAVFGTSTPPIFTSSSDIERSVSSGYLDTVVRGAALDFSLKRANTISGLTTTQNNLSVGTDYTVVNLSSSSSAQTITGFADGVDGRILVVRVLLSASFGVVLAHNSGSSLAANRILSITGANVTIPPGGAVMMIYGTGGWYILN